jgi:hypothetical protein
MPFSSINVYNLGAKLVQTERKTKFIILSLQLFVSLQRQIVKVKQKIEQIMKTNLLLMLTTLLFSVSSCRVNLGEGAEKIEPSENIVKAKYPQQAFDKVDNHVVGNIQLVQSKDGKSRVTLSAPENYIKFFEFKNEDGKLDIRFTENNINIDTRDVTIIIYSPQLREINNSGASDMRLDSLNTDELKVKNSGVGSFTMSKVKARKIDVSCSGVGSINISGEVNEAEYSCSGVGNINAKDMIARDVKAHISGVGGIECYATDYINGSVTGVGGLKYGGHPAKKDLHSSMTGGISEL